MSTVIADSNTTAPTEFLQGKLGTYAYRRIGGGIRRPLLCLQHFTGTLDNWDPAVTDPLASDREVILFDNAGVGRSTGTVPTTVPGMAAHALEFLDALCLISCDVLGFSLGGMVAQQMALDRPSSDPSDDSGRHCAAGRRRHHASRETEPGEAPGRSHSQGIRRVAEDLLCGESVEPGSRRSVHREACTTQRGPRHTIRVRRRGRTDGGVPGVGATTATGFADFKGIQQPTLVVNGIDDEMIPVSNSYRLVENLPNAVLLVYPDSGHGSLFQFHESFTRQVSAFLASNSPLAPY